MNLKGLFYLLSFSLISNATMGQQALAVTWKTVGPPRVFTNSTGVVVTVVDLNPAGKTKRAAIEISGTNSDADRAPQLTEIRDEGRRVNFVRIEGKKEFYTLTMSRSGSYWNDVTLPIPGTAQSASLVFNDKRSKEADGKEVLRKLLLRRPAGASAQADAKAQKMADEKLFQEQVLSAADACGAKFKPRIDWPTFAGDSTQVMEVGAACGQVAEAITALCSDEEGQKAFKKFDEINCVFAVAPSVKVSGKKINFATAVDTPHQYQLAYTWFENNL